jgi:hypothetical protein
MQDEAMRNLSREGILLEIVSLLLEKELSTW